MSKTYNIVTFGCQMNEHDSENIAGMLENMGYIKNEERNSADVAIINTCSIRENADKRFFGTLGQLKKVKENNPEFVVAVCGCMMQQQHIVDKIKKTYPWVDLVFGTHNIHEFPKLLDNVVSEHEKIIDVWDTAGDIIEGLPTKRVYNFKSYVNITYGCNNFCTYCIVPYTRGRERSRKPADIIGEIEKLVKSGVKEVTLLGQNVNSYGKNCNFKELFSDNVDFADLIMEIDKSTGIKRLKFMTSHPKDLSDKLIATYGMANSLCNSIHLPVQSGSSEVLKRMNRRYSREDYMTLIKKLRKVSPNIAITTDIIVGFPGESEENFMETMDLVEKVRFDSAFTFLYSIRKGTPAAEYENQIPEKIKHERFNMLVERMNQITMEINRTYVGKEELVLVEGESKRNSMFQTGRTGSGKIVNFRAGRDLKGEIVAVKIVESNTFSLIGELL